MPFAPPRGMERGTNEALRERRASGPAGRLDQLAEREAGMESARLPP